MMTLCLTLAGCSQKRTDVSQIINKKASIPGDLPFNPFQWRVLSVSVNGKELTMSTLYGNEIAAHQARTDIQHRYPAGSQLALITWYQQEDEHWFGARIPATIKSIEFVTVNGPANRPLTYSYQAYEGAPLKSSLVDPASKDQRINYLLAQRPLVMP
jgi:hypothetical protein